MILITGLTHMATGALAGALLYRATGDALVSGAVVIGSLLPDIDHPGSKLGRRVPIISHIMYLFGHRAMTHSLLFVIALALLGTFVSPIFYGLSIGSLVHIAADMLTPSGVPLFWPLGRRYSILGFRTGGIADWFIGLSASVLAVLVVIGRG